MKDQHRPFVLVADDDFDVREIVSEVLRHAGCDVVTAMNGAEALTVLADRREPTILLLDLMMPIMDGFQVAAAIRANPALWRVDIIAMTAAYTTPGRIGAVPMLRKPMDLDELVALVQERWKRLAAALPGARAS